MIHLQIWRLCSFIFWVRIACCLPNSSWIEHDTDTNLASQFTILASKCNIERHDARSLTVKEFLSRYAYHEPVVIYGVEDNNDFAAISEKENLLNQFGDKPVVLSSANTHSYKKVKSTLAGYINDYMKPQSLNSSGVDTYYLFGDIDATVWHDLLNQYKAPKYKVPGLIPALSFGIGGQGTGVPFHFHGPGFGEIIHGRKHWFLYPFKEKPDFDPDQSSLHWYTHSYPNLPRDKLPLECSLGANEVNRMVCLDYGYDDNLVRKCGKPLGLTCLMNGLLNGL